MAGAQFANIDASRRKHGFRCVAETIALAETNTIFDPYSTLTARDAEIGSGNVFYPGVVLRLDGGARVIADQRGAEPRIGDRARLLNGAEIMGSSELESGAQGLGAISARGVVLGGGGDFNEPDPDRRGAVLKGFSRAQGVRLAIGEVMNGAGDFARAKVERQLAYYPRSGAQAGPPVG